MRQRALAVSLALLLDACGGSPTTPTVVTPPTPKPANVAGNWSGTLESTSYVPLAVVVTMNQTSTAVTGTWAASTGTSGLAGNISGTVDATSFTGTITLSINQTTGCSGSFSGPANTSAPTLSWAGAGFTGNCNLSNGNPVSPRFVLQRR